MLEQELIPSKHHARCLSVFPKYYQYVLCLQHMPATWQWKYMTLGGMRPCACRCSDNNKEQRAAQKPPQHPKRLQQC